MDIMYSLQGIENNENIANDTILQMCIPGYYVLHFIKLYLVKYMSSIHFYLNGCI